MDINSLINTQVDNAFGIVDSALTEVTFNLREGESFNFGTAETEVGSSKLRTVRALIAKTVYYPNVERKQLVFKGVSGLDAYDTVTIGGLVYQMGPTVYDNGYIKIVEVYRG